MEGRALPSWPVRPSLLWCGSPPVVGERALLPQLLDMFCAGPQRVSSGRRKKKKIRLPPVAKAVSPFKAKSVAATTQMWRDWAERGGEPRDWMAAERGVDLNRVWQVRKKNAPSVSFQSELQRLRMHLFHTMEQHSEQTLNCRANIACLATTRAGQLRHQAHA